MPKHGREKVTWLVGPLECQIFTDVSKFRSPHSRRIVRTARFDDVGQSNIKPRRKESRWEVCYRSVKKRKKSRRFGRS